MPPHQHIHAHSHAESHAHSHALGERHPHAEVSPSLLRFSAWQRLAIAAVFAAMMWAAVFWAIGWKP